MTNEERADRARKLHEAGAISEATRRKLSEPRRVMVGFDLTGEQARSLRGWLVERLDEMRPDAPSIDREDRNLLPAIRSVLTQLNGAR